MNSKLLSLITGQPMADNQYEYTSRVPRALGETIATGNTVYTVIATGPARPQGQMILVQGADLRTVIGTYRMPRQGGQPSITLTCTLTANGCTMAGGKSGSYTIPGTAWDKRRLAAHWAGYVSNNMGRTVKPATLRWPVEVESL